MSGEIEAIKKTLESKEDSIFSVEKGKYFKSSVTWESKMWLSVQDHIDIRNFILSKYEDKCRMNTNI